MCPLSDRSDALKVGHDFSFCLLFILLALHSVCSPICLLFILFALHSPCSSFYSPFSRLSFASLRESISDDASEWQTHFVATHRPLSNPIKFPIKSLSVRFACSTLSPAKACGDLRGSLRRFGNIWENLRRFGKTWEDLRKALRWFEKIWEDLRRFFERNTRKTRW